MFFSIAVSSWRSWIRDSDVSVDLFTSFNFLRTLATSALTKSYISVLVAESSLKLVIGSP